MQLKLIFNATECNGWPKIRFFIDLDQIEDLTTDSNNIEVNIPIDLLDGEHNLDIELYGKKPINTIIDAQKNIIKDQIVELVDIYVDNIQLPTYFKYLGIYHYNNIAHPQALTWGINGIWKWSFTTPIIPWILEKKIEQKLKYSHDTKEYQQNLKLTQQKIKNFLREIDEL
jgi:hypothetical protein